MLSSQPLTQVDGSVIVAFVNIARLAVFGKIEGELTDIRSTACTYIYIYIGEKKDVMCRCIGCDATPISPKYMAYIYTYTYICLYIYIYTPIGHV